jgi:acetyltransferase-like isoleucine patch superfamily enzyme
MKNIFLDCPLKLNYSEADEYQKAEIYSRYFKVNMGKRVRITGTPAFGSEPYLITIGDDVTIIDVVIFHTHDGGVGILRKKYPGINISKPIRIGNNVFIGSNTTIFPGKTIGNNVVIGASGVVTKNIPNDVLVASVQVRIIRSLSDYETAVLKEAVFITETDLFLEKGRSGN